eukprot:UN10791
MFYHCFNCFSTVRFSLSLFFFPLFSFFLLSFPSCFSFLSFSPISTLSCPFDRVLLSFFLVCFKIVCLS